MKFSLMRRSDAADNNQTYRQQLSDWVRIQCIDPKDVPVWSGSIAYRLGLARIEMVERDERGQLIIEGDHVKTKAKWKLVWTPPPRAWHRVKGPHDCMLMNCARGPSWMAEGVGRDH